MGACVCTYNMYLGLQHLTCICIFSEEDVPAYKLPYEEEAGLRPSLERLKDIVVTRKLRPSLPAIWGNHEVR